jgi:hypothetical protein
MAGKLAGSYGCGNVWKSGKSNVQSRWNARWHDHEEQGEQNEFCATRPSSEAGVDGFGFEGEDAEDAFVDAT